MRRLLALTLLAVALPATAHGGPSLHLERVLRPPGASTFGAPALGADGVLWVEASADDVPGRLRKLGDSGRRPLLSVPRPSDGLPELALAPDGTLYVAASGEPLRRLTPRGTPVRGFRTRGLSRLGVQDVGVDGRGRVVVAATDLRRERDEVLRLRPDGRLERRLLVVDDVTDDEVVTDLAVSGSGRVALLLCDESSTGCTLLVLGPDGRPETPAPVPLGVDNGRHVALAREHVVVLHEAATGTGGGRGVLSVFSPAGRRLAGPTRGRASALLHEQASMTAGPRGRLVLLDGGQVKLLRLRP